MHVLVHVHVCAVIVCVSIVLVEVCQALLDVYSIVPETCGSFCFVVIVVAIVVIAFLICISFFLSFIFIIFLQGKYINLFYTCIV